MPEEVEASSIEKQDYTFECPHYFGYLHKRPRDAGVPEECLACKKVVDCMLFALRGGSSELEGENKIESVELSRQEDVTEVSTKAPFESGFVVEDMGMLYASWSSTVRIHREKISEWGGKVKEVEVEASSGRRARCKVMPMEDLRMDVIQVPDKVQQELGVMKGDIVKVKPITKS